MQGRRPCMPRFLALAAMLTCCRFSPAAEPAWQPWSDDLFARAKAEHRLVLLDLEAGWCHWCHVMDETTYRDAAVAGLLSSKYLLVRVDQDARPDLSKRYEDYGWAAAAGVDAARRGPGKRSGRHRPQRMAGNAPATVRR